MIETSAFRARIAGHPLRPMLFQVPVVCFTGALLTDITYSRSGDIQWANFSAWLLFAGTVFAVMALVAGFVDHTNKRLRAIAAQRALMVGLIFVVVLALFDNFVHSRDAWTSVVPTGLTLSILLAVATWITAWLGGSVLYGAPRTYAAHRETVR